MSSARDRLFYSIPKFGQLEDYEQKKDNSKLLSYIRNNIIGQRKQFSGPFGLREALYLDYTASGKSLRFIEDYIREQVLPEYGNTHTTSSVTSLQTTLYRHEARDIVRNAVHASEHDAVIFVGSGSTAAVHKLIHASDLKTSPVVIVGPYEHHSNLLPWKEIGAKVLRVKADAEGLVDLDHLLHLLKKWKASGRQLIGCFSAASNITGILVDVDAINIMLHKHGALAFWDFATAAPYVQIDMNPVSASADQPYMYKDAVFISCHKFVGGVQTPGILIAKKSLFRNSTPGGCGGGSVFFVRREDHRYLQEPELKEEGGTPAIIESVRAGLVFQLKQAVSTSLIMEREDYLLKRAVEAWKDHPSLILLGNTEVPRLPIFSFLVYHKESGRFLHHNFVSVLLNDLFGIQARGGCACAGPYAMDLLGMEEDMSKQIENMLAEDSRLDRTHLRRYREYSQREILRPGFTRINLPYFMDDETLEFVLEAVKIVAEEGWKLLPQYMFNPETGEWRQVNFQVFKDRKWLGHISYASGEMAYKIPPPVNKGPLPDNYEDCLQKARDLCLRSSKSRYQLADHTVMFDEGSRKYRWFVLPSEAAQCLKGNKVPVEGNSLPFCPPSLRETIGLPALILDNADEEDVNDVTDLIDQSGVENILRNGDNIKYTASTADKDSLKSFSEGFSECIERGFQCKDTETCNMASICDVKEDLKTDCNDSGNDTIMSTEGPMIQKDNLDTVKCNKSISDLNKTVSSKSDTLGCFLACNDATEMSNGVLTDDFCNSEKKNAASNNKTGLVEPQETCVQGCNSESKVKSDIFEDTNSLKANEKTNVLNVRENTNSLNRRDIANSLNTNENTNSSNTNGLNTKENTNTKAEGKTDSLQREGSTNSLSTSQLSGSVKTIADNQTTVITDEASENKERVCRKRPVAQNSSNEDNQVKKIKENGDGKVNEGQVGEIISSQGMSNGTEKKKRKENKWCSPPKTIFTPFLKAIEEFNMIQDGDCVLVCLSGGKDSLSLLHAVHQYKYYCRKKNITFALGAVTVDPQTPSYDPSPLKLYLASLGVPYFYESQGILEQASNLPYECASICSFCSRMKRGRIYACARREGYNVLALGQHLDDLCESFMMSVFHNGNLRTMKAHYTVEEGDLRVIRPFVYVREKDLRTFAEQNKLPVIAENCPACFEAPKERHRIKQLLAAQEIMFPRIYPSMLSAIKPIMAINKTQIKLADMINQTEDETVDDIDI